MLMRKQLKERRFVMKGIAKKKSFGRFCLAFVIFLVACVISLPSVFADQSRGISVVAYDKASGKNKEVRLYNKSYAVVIGIDQYTNLPFDKQLSYAVQDAKGVAEILKKNFKFDKIITLYNGEATKANIMKVLSGDLSKISEKDSVFVFWAGHGYTEKTSRGDLGYLVPFDGTFEESQLYENISMTMIKDDISKRIPAKHIFYVMDSCYSGLLVSKRGATRKTARDFNYLQEITKEEACQVLTAGSKDQQVLDGGPRGHSVFTGRFIEVLENADDFITATEVSAIVKERVFSDARTRGHTQTPKYGELFGLGDYVFVPSLERKVEDTQAKLAGLQREMEQIKAVEAAAAKAKDERAQRTAGLDRIAIEAKLKAEQLKQQALEEERKKREQAALERERQAAELARQKQEDEKRLAALKQVVEEKRKDLGGTTLSSLSPEKTLTEMKEIDAKILEMRKRFRTELKNGIIHIVERFNDSFLRLVEQKKDEFETQAEFDSRIAKETSELNNEQASEFDGFQTRIETAYSQQIKPFIEQLKKLSSNEFTLRADNLILELGTYDGTTDTYLVTIRAKQPIKGILVASNANIPIPRQEAREFKQHFQNNMLRPEIVGNFQTPDVFMISQAYVIDDATTKKYDLFSARFVDLGNGTLYDPRTKLIWSKEGSSKTWWTKNRLDYIKRLNDQAHCGFRDWRLPTLKELHALVKYAKSAGYGSRDKTIADYLNKEGFSNIKKKPYWTLSNSITFTGGNYKAYHGDTCYALAVRSGR